MIISNNNINVNINGDNNTICITSSAPTAPTAPTKFQKIIDKKRKSNIIVQRLMQINMKGRAKRMNECSTLMEVGFCECGRTEILRANTCKDKLCPICNWRLSMKRYSEMIAITNQVIEKNPNATWSFITLTVKNSNNLDVSLKEMSQAWKRLLQRKIIKENVIGTAKAVEITYNKQTNEFHPHFHILTVNKNQLDINELWRVWRDCNYNMTVSAKAQNYQDIKYNRDNEQIEGENINIDLTPAILETFKYSTKTSDLEEMPLKMFKRYVNEVAGKRMMSFTGVLKKERQAYISNQEDLEHNEMCSSCGNTELQHMIARWSFEKQTYLTIDPNRETLKNAEKLALELQQAIRKQNRYNEIDIAVEDDD